MKNKPSKTPDNVGSLWFLFGTVVQFCSECNHRNNKNAFCL